MFTTDRQALSSSRISVNVTVEIVDDNLFEVDERFNVTANLSGLFTPRDRVTLSPNQAEVIIHDDDRENKITIMQTVLYSVTSMSVEKGHDYSTILPQAQKWTRLCDIIID